MWLSAAFSCSNVTNFFGSITYEPVHHSQQNGVNSQKFSHYNKILTLSVKHKIYVYYSVYTI